MISVFVGRGEQEQRVQVPHQGGHGKKSLESYYFSFNSVIFYVSNINFHPFRFSDKVIVIPSQMAAQLEQYAKAVSTFEEIAFWEADHATLKYAAKTHFFQALVCKLNIDLVSYFPLCLVEVWW